VEARRVLNIHEKGSCSGITLIEVILVIIIAGILVAVALRSAVTVSDRELFRYHPH